MRLRAQAERMPGRIGKDAVAGLLIELRAAHPEHQRLPDVEIVDPEVQVELHR